jgi:hypothetical protein
MAYRRLTHENVATVVGLWQSRESERKIARLTGIDRKTVRRYLAAAERAALTRDCSTTEADINGLVTRVQSRSKSVSSATRAELAGHEAQISAWLSESPPLRLREVHRRLVAQGVRVTYWTLRRFAIQVRASDEPRELARAASVIPPAPESGVQSSVRGINADSRPHTMACEFTG